MDLLIGRPCPPLAARKPASTRPVLRLFLSCAAFALSGNALLAAPDGYVPLARIALQYRLVFNRNIANGVVVCEGNGTTLTTGPGLSLVLLNGEALRLSMPVLEENGVLYVPAEVAGAIDARAARREGPPPARLARLAGEPVGEPAPARPTAGARTDGLVRPPYRRFAVVIDAGHGGEHSGARGRQGTTEKVVNLDVARRLQQLLTEAGMQAILTRTSDAHFAPNVQEDLHRRFNIGNNAVPDLFISIHANWAEDPSARGFEIYIRREHLSDVRTKLAEGGRLRLPSDRLGGGGVDDPAVGRMLTDLLIERSDTGSRLVAREVERNFVRGLSTENRGIRERDFQVVRWSHAPAVLVELEFLSNPRGERELGSAAHRERVAKLLADAVVAFRARWAPGTAPGPGRRDGLTWSARPRIPDVP